MKPNEAFTPRATAINDTYVPRSEEEKKLGEYLECHKHIVIYGESGTGKSWLYQKVLKDLKVEYQVISITMNDDSIVSKIKKTIELDGKPKNTSYDEKKGIEAGAVLSNDRHYEIPEEEPFYACLKKLRERAKKKTAVLVFENLEQITNQSIFKELVDIIMTCDNQEYSQFDIKIIIVAALNTMDALYNASPVPSTVRNRIVEIKLKELKDEEFEVFIKEGFQKKLQYSIKDLHSTIARIKFFTLKTPQALQEYCLELAKIAQEKCTIENDMLSEAAKNWLNIAMASFLNDIKGYMNEKASKIGGRRNQVLYALRFVKPEFTSDDVVKMIRKKFSLEEDSPLNISSILTTLADDKTRPIILRTPNQKTYRFKDIRYQQTLKASLGKESDGKVFIK